MKYVISKIRGVPAYLQLYGALKSDIVSGIMPPGSKMPSKRLLAEELGISVITAEHAYAMLCDEGYVTARERSGFFVCGDGVAIPSAGAPRSSVVHTQAAVDPEFPFSAYAKTIRRVLTEYDKELLVKSPGKGCENLRRAIRDYLARVRGFTADVEQIVIGSGAEYLYAMLTQLFGRDEVYGIEDPSYDKIEKVYRANGVKTERLELGADGITSAALERTAARILHVTPFRSFPSGVTASAAKRAEYLRFAKERDGYVVEDDFESEFSVYAKPADTLFSADTAGRVIYLNTFSKSLSSAMRVGYMVLPPRLAERYTEKLGFYSCTVPVFDQYILAEFIESGELERHINRTRRKNRKRAMI